ncbi:MAG: UDP-N-acetylmuramoyl-tripeptide--D-alanyl-D-alanine ligase [Flavobacteriaceae bacterium]
MNIDEFHNLFLAHPKICTDSRHIIVGGIFFALRGSNFDGNKFALQAIEQGASYAVVDDSSIVHPKCILVENTLTFLQKVATYHRNYCKTKVICLTGSNGKTTTKELIYAVLSKRYLTLATEGNFNNHIGVPLTLLRLDPEHEYAVVELGANHMREIEALSQIAQPDYGLITNFGKAHIEGFGSVENIVKGKLELFSYLKSKGKTIFYHTNDQRQCQELIDYSNKHPFGINSQLQLIQAIPHIELKHQQTVIQSELFGAYNADNISAAIAIGSYFEVSDQQIKQAISAYRPSNMRSQLLIKGGYDIILDTYNANPSSMELALRSFHQTYGENSLPIVGDMFELGNHAKVEHQNTVHLLQDLGFKNAVLIGTHFSTTKSDYLKFLYLDDFIQWLKINTIEEKHLFIKGSRSMTLETILEHL